MSKLLPLLMTSSVAAFGAEQQKPNIIIINADDVGYGDLSCYGATKIQTPNIDKLAQEGTRFTDAHSPSAVCTPSRYGLITGTYPHRGNVWGPTGAKNSLILPQDKINCPKLMKQAGYSTAVIGKWHLGLTNGKPDYNKPLKPGPNEIGYDYSFILPSVNSSAPYVYVENSNVLGLDPNDPFVWGKKAKTQAIHEKGGIRIIGGADKAHELYDDYKVGTKFTEMSLKWMKAQKKKPFFLNLMTTNIHHPFTPAKRFQGTSQCGLYGDFVHELDWIVGEVVKTADEIEEETGRETLIIFTSDNGGMLNAGGQKAWEMGHRLNGDLLGFKFGAWEGGHRVPFIARWNGRIPAGRVSNNLISQIDILATLAQITKQKQPEGTDSIGQLDELFGKTSKPLRSELVILANSMNHVSIRTKKWLYIPTQGTGGFTSKWGKHTCGGPAAQLKTKQVTSDVLNGKWRKDAPGAQLYDLENDLGQSQNVINSFPEIAKALQKKAEFHKSNIPDTKPVGWISSKAYVIKKTK